MKLAILSCGPNAYSTQRLKEAALQRGHDVRVLNTLKFAIDLQRGVPDLYYRQKSLSTYDAVLPRIGASITYYGTAVVRQFQEMDVFVLIPRMELAILATNSGVYKSLVATISAFQEQPLCATRKMSCPPLNV